MTKLSVIVPVYNAENYLERCLDSLIEQTLDEIEIICVDDNSADKSLEILKKYAKKDERLRYIHCDINGGESKARNIGLDNANGEFIAFVDNDDTVDIDFYEKLYNKARETKGKPTAIIAKTTKGKGVSFMENQCGWHGKAPNDEEFDVAMKDLED